jgi:CDP-diacylglycerol---glycerol-3-phosphate 3-phosphatidyltransferase
MIICIRAPEGPAILTNKMVWNLPNTLTWLRIFAIPLVIVLFYLPYQWADPAAGLLFAAAGITDSLDGYLARRMGQTSRLGAFLDPVADKLIVAVALVLLLSKEMPKIIVPGIEGLDGGHATLRPESVRVILVLSAIVIIGREIAISALREWMAEIGQRGKVKVSQLAKYKTILQIVGLSCMLFRWNLTLWPGFSLPIFEIGLVLTVVAAALTLWSAIQYLRAAWPDLRGHA